MPAPPSILTLEAANALLPRLKSLMALQMGRRSEIEQLLQRLGELLGGVPETVRIEDSDSSAVRELKRVLAETVETYRSGWREVEEMGAVLKDPRMGLVDFCGQVDGRRVWLCWRYGEDAVTHYHEIDEGFAGRKPIGSTMRHRHLN